MAFNPNRFESTAGSGSDSESSSSDGDEAGFRESDPSISDSGDGGAGDANGADGGAEQVDEADDPDTGDTTSRQLRDDATSDPMAEQTEPDPDPRREQRREFQEEQEAASEPDVSDGSDAGGGTIAEDPTADVDGSTTDPAADVGGDGTTDTSTIEEQSGTDDDGVTDGDAGETPTAEETVQVGDTEVGASGPGTDPSEPDRTVEETREQQANQQQRAQQRREISRFGAEQEQAVREQRTETERVLTGGPGPSLLASPDVTAAEALRDEARREAREQARETRGTLTGGPGPTLLAAPGETGAEALREEAEAEAEAEAERRAMEAERVAEQDLLAAPGTTSGEALRDEAEQTPPVQERFGSDVFALEVRGERGELTRFEFVGTAVDTAREKARRQAEERQAPFVDAVVSGSELGPLTPDPESFISRGAAGAATIASGVLNPEAAALDTLDVGEAGLELLANRGRITADERELEATEESGEQIIATAEETAEAAAAAPGFTAGALLGAALPGVALGLGAGSAGRRVVDRVRTAGSRRVDISDLTQESVLRGESEFPGADDPDLYRSDPAEAVREQAEGRTTAEIEQSFEEAGAEGVTLKKALDVEPEGPGGSRAAQGFESAPDETGIDPSDITAADVADTDAGPFAYESPGSFVSTDFSTYFLRGEGRSSFSLRPGLPSLGDRPTGVLVRTDVEPSEADEGLGFAQEMARREGETTARTKPPDEVNTGEIEAVIPPGASFRDVGGSRVRSALRQLGVGSDFYTDVGGRRVPLRRVVPDESTPDVDVDTDDIMAADADAGAADNPAFSDRSIDEIYESPEPPTDRPAPIVATGGPSSGGARSPMAAPSSTGRSRSPIGDDLLAAPSRDGGSLDSGRDPFSSGRSPIADDDLMSSPSRDRDRSALSRDLFSSSPIGDGLTDDLMSSPTGGRDTDRSSGLSGNPFTGSGGSGGDSGSPSDSFSPSGAYTPPSDGGGGSGGSGGSGIPSEPFTPVATGGGGSGGSPFSPFAPTDPPPQRPRDIDLGGDLDQDDERREEDFDPRVMRKSRSLINPITGE